MTGASFVADTGWARGWSHSASRKSRAEGTTHPYFIDTERSKGLGLPRVPRRMSAGAGSQAQARGFFLQHPLNVVQAPASVVLNAAESSGPGARVNTSGEGRNTKEERNQSMEYFGVRAAPSCLSAQD